MAAESFNTVTQQTPHGGLPQMQTESFPGQIFWLVVTFGLLFLVLWRITLPMIEGVIGERRNRIEGDLSAAEKLRQQAADALAGYEAELTGARNRAHQILDESRKAIAAQLEELKARADSESQAAMKQAEERVAAERTRAMGSLKSAAAEAASAIVERLVAIRVSTDEAVQAVNEQASA